MPHNDGIKAQVERLDQVIFSTSFFGESDVRIFLNSDTPEEISGVVIDIDDAWIRGKLCVTSDTGATVTDEDVLLWCERVGDTIRWYRVTYHY